MRVCWLKHGHRFKERRRINGRAVLCLVCEDCWHAVPVLGAKDTARERVSLRQKLARKLRSADGSVI